MDHSFSQDRGLLSPYYRFLARWRYPASMPEDVARALGVPFSNRLPFPQFLDSLVNPALQITRLKKFMPRSLAEKMFHAATQKEFFKQTTLFSFYFPEGWIEFRLIFDDSGRLRRIYLEHKDLQDIFELRLSIYTQKTSKFGFGQRESSRD